MEALGRGAAQQAGARSQSCAGIQRRTAEGGRDVHPHVRRAHERAHGESDAAQPGTGGCLWEYAARVEQQT